MHTATGTAIKQTNDAEQYRAANKRDDHNDRMNSRRLTENDRSDNVVDRQGEARWQIRTEKPLPRSRFVGLQ